MKLAPRAAALGMAVLCHGAFVAAVASMAWSLAGGVQSGSGTVSRPLAPFVNALLLLQFPLLHSFLLARRGQRALARLSPVGHGKALAVSTYVLIASLQLLLAFHAWTPSGVVWHRPHGGSGMLQWVVFGAAWLFLQKALFDAGLGVQTGFAGWWALLHRRAVRYGGMPTAGLFRLCRQPIYLGFALVLWTAPTWSLDWLALACGWTVYCVVGPRWKEARWLAWFGPRFAAYRATVPYLLPLPRARR